VEKTLSAFYNNLKYQKGYLLAMQREH